LLLVRRPHLHIRLRGKKAREKGGVWDMVEMWGSVGNAEGVEELRRKASEIGETGDQDGAPCRWDAWFLDVFAWKTVQFLSLFRTSFVVGR
jgi:hypothetical protein